MAEQFQTFKLSCISCGGNLDISRDMDKFACNYCGTEQRVEHKGGTVALKPVTDAISKIQIGTDKTAAELALKRLGRELSKLKEKRRQQEAKCRNQVTERKVRASDQRSKERRVSFVLLFVFFCFLGISAGLNSGLGLTGLVLGIIGFVLRLVFINRQISKLLDNDIQKTEQTANKKLMKLDEQIKDLNRKMEHNRVIADS